MTEPPTRIVAADANVLINLIHVSRLGFCAGLPGLGFVVPDHVRAEIVASDQRAILDRAIEGGLLRVVSIGEPDDIDLFSNLITRLGRGEAACLVLAVRHGWMVGSDEKRRFRREAADRIGTVEFPRFCGHSKGAMMRREVSDGPQKEAAVLSGVQG